MITTYCFKCWSSRFWGTLQRQSVMWNVSVCKQKNILNLICYIINRNAREAFVQTLGWNFIKFPSCLKLSLITVNAVNNVNCFQKPLNISPRVLKNQIWQIKILLQNDCWLLAVYRVFISLAVHRVFISLALHRVFISLTVYRVFIKNIIFINTKFLPL